MPPPMIDQHANSSDEDSERMESSDSEEYKDAALNLLDMRDRARKELQTQPGNPENAQGFDSHSSIPLPDPMNYSTYPHIPTVQNPGIYSESSKLETISITKYYEPKFLQIFNKYCESTQQNISPAEIGKQHLMVLCLNHLIPFCSWARENSNRYNWIKLTLDDNVDLRPEVRNGLSMILIYSFSAAQAKEKREADMFTVLQDNDTGLGIVNKTSLKIYNDPFQYFNFLKTSISGLIDGGKIPENERINQVSIFSVSFFTALTNCFVILMLSWRVFNSLKNRKSNLKTKKKLWPFYKSKLG